MAASVAGTPEAFSSQRKWVAGASLVAALVMGLVASAPGAEAAVSCYWYDPPGGLPSSIQVTYTETGDTVNIVRDLDNIAVNGGPCTDGSTIGTVTNTDYVNLLSPDSPIGDTKTKLSLAGGEFEPGFEGPGYEGSGVLFLLAMDQSSYSSPGDILEIGGSTGDDGVRLGLTDSEYYVNLDTDDDDDVDLLDGQVTNGTLHPTTDKFLFEGYDGADTASGRGGAGTGAQAQIPLVLDGGNGGDSLGGAARKDALRGADGSDTLKGFAGNDLLIGGPGSDVLVGGPGTDECRGGPDPPRHARASGALDLRTRCRGLPS